MDFRRKCRFIARGDQTETPAAMTYSSVVSRDSVRIAFPLAALNDVDVMTCDPMNAHLNTPCREKIWFEGGRETGDGFGKVCVVTRTLHGLKSSSASWRSDSAKSLEELGFESVLADPDVWRRAARKENRFEHHELVLVHVDDMLVVSHQGQEVMDNIEKAHDMKEGGVMRPNQFLGVTIEEPQMPDG